MDKKKVDHLKEVEDDFFELTDVNPTELQLKYFGDDVEEVKPLESTIWDWGTEVEELQKTISQLVTDAIEASKGDSKKAQWYQGVSQGMLAILDLYFKDDITRLKELERETDLLRNPQGKN